MIEVLQQSDAGVILMHMRGTPKTMQIDPHYEDVVGEVFEFLRQRRDELVLSGVDRARIAIDPGYGFRQARSGQHGAGSSDSTGSPNLANPSLSESPENR